MRCRKRWGRDVAGCGTGGGACGSEERALGIARVMVQGHLWTLATDDVDVGRGKEGAR